MEHEHEYTLLSALVGDFSASRIAEQAYVSALDSLESVNAMLEECASQIDAINQEMLKESNKVLSFSKQRALAMKQKKSEIISKRDEFMSAKTVQEFKDITNLLEGISTLSKKASDHFQNAYKEAGTLIHSRREQDVILVCTKLGSLSSEAWVQLMSNLVERANVKISVLDIEAVTDRLKRDSKTIQKCITTLTQSIQKTELDLYKKYHSEHREARQTLISFRSFVFETAVAMSLTNSPTVLQDISFFDGVGSSSGLYFDTEMEFQSDALAKYFRDKDRIDSEHVADTESALSLRATIGSRLSNFENSSISTSIPVSDISRRRTHDRHQKSQSTITTIAKSVDRPSSEISTSTTTTQPHPPTSPNRRNGFWHRAMFNNRNFLRRLSTSFAEALNESVLPVEVAEDSKSGISEDDDDEIKSKVSNSTLDLFPANYEEDEFNEQDSQTPRLDEPYSPTGTTNPATNNFTINSPFSPTSATLINSPRTPISPLEFNRFTHHDSESRIKYLSNSRNPNSALTRSTSNASQMDYSSFSHPQNLFRKIETPDDTLLIPPAPSTNATSLLSTTPPSPLSVGNAENIDRALSSTSTPLKTVFETEVVEDKVENATRKLQLIALDLDGEIIQLN
ncbi:hypothetical protein HK098_003113 [Nowakowskiella sp. JEL0407]|nr:hypothetical protein HK098_003113 [Nowakowskiella sp. JEL0407]